MPAATPASRWSGSAPPADFRTGYIGEVTGGDGLAFGRRHHQDGHFVVLEGGPNSLAQLGPGVQGHKRPHCDPNRKARPGAPMAKSIAPPDLLRDSKFKTPCLKALGPLARASRLARLTGRALEVKNVQAAGTGSQIASACKSHDCAKHSAVRRDGATQGGVVGEVDQAGRSTLIGNPPPALAREVERLWTEEWQRKP